MKNKWSRAPFPLIITNLMIISRIPASFLSSYQSLSPSVRQKDFSSDPDFPSFTTHLISNSVFCITQQTELGIAFLEVTSKGGSLKQEQKAHERDGCCWLLQAVLLWPVSYITPVCWATSPERGSGPAVLVLGPQQGSRFVHLVG